MKNSLKKSVLGCAAISLSLCALAEAQTPAIALIDAADGPMWEPLAREAGWRIVAPPAGNTPDARVQSLAAAVQQAITQGADPSRIYLAGRGPAAAAVFYTIARVPDLWAAGLAIEGSPQPAVDTGRLFTANFTNVPVLWIGGQREDEALARDLKTAGLNLEWRAPAGLSNGAILDWLKSHRRDPAPSAIDCETNSPAFASCYWIRMTKFDTGERNDVLPSTALQVATRASLDLGAFGYSTTDPGPGLLVSVLPEKYNGPLKTGDRIVALEGRPIQNARAFGEMLAKYTEEKPVVATVQRGKDRVRVETRVLLPKREAIFTARVQAHYNPAEKEIQIVSRTVKEMRVSIPPEWHGSRLYWNGLMMEKVEPPGCYLLSIEKELLRAAKCQ